MIETNETTIILVRHGETEWNLERKQQGHLDSPLTENGVKQAQLAAKSLAGRHVDIMYSSDLGRAVQTAEIIGTGLDMKVNLDSRLRERNFGVMQGMTVEEFQTQWPEEAARVSNGEPDYQVAEGESKKQFYDRCVEACDTIAGKHPRECVLLVSHGGFLQSVFHRICRIELTRPRCFSMINAAINSFTISNGDWRLVSWGVATHLDGLIALDDL